METEWMWKQTVRNTREEAQDTAWVLPDWSEGSLS